MARQKLTFHLRHLSTAKFEEEYFSYHQYSAKRSQSLEKLVSEVCKAGTSGSLPCGQIYNLQLLKKIFLAEFRLLSASTELQDDVEYSFTQLQTLCEAVEEFNVAISDGNFPSSAKRFEFADFADVLVVVHSTLIAKKLLKHNSDADIIHLAKFEYGFVNALLGTVATYTNMANTCPFGASNTKLVYVSEEMFSIAKKGSGFSWLDCLIPGAQSDVLRITGQQLIARIWEHVAENLLTAIEAMGCRQQKELLLSRLSNMSDCEDLQYHSPVTSCLRHVSSYLDQCTKLSVWDSAFQQMLGTTTGDARKGYRPFKLERVTRTTHCLLTSVLPPIDQYMISNALVGGDDLHSPLIAAKHFNSLKLGRTLSAGLCSTICHLKLFLILGLQNVLANWNMRAIAQLLFVDGPAIIAALTNSVAISATSSSPLLLVPPYSHLYTLEWSCRNKYSLIHEGCTQLKNALEEQCLVFHDCWTRRCAVILRDSFPTQKSWKRLGKKNSISQLAHSGYCDIVVETLLLPLVEAAAVLPEGGQRSLVGLAVSILANELRRAITSNKLTYTSLAGRQMLTDLRYIWKWITSSKLGLAKSVLQLLSTLPALEELEHGILMLCGTADEQTKPSQTAATFTDDLFSPHLPIFKELAWHSERDWSRCIA